MLVAVIAASALMHVLLWPLGDEVLGWALSGSTLPRAEGIMEVSLLDSERPEPEIEPEPPVDPEPPPGKLVQLDRVDDERAPPEDTKYVSEFDHRASSPTRAPNVAPRPGAVATPRGDEGRDGKAPSDARTPSPSTALPLLPGTSAEDVAGDADPVDPGRTGEMRPGGGPPVPSVAGSPGARKALLEALGNPGSFDQIDDAEDGDSTSVDTKRWKYASFFNRVRSSIAQHWHPEQVHAANDPDGRKYGTKTRRTRLLISLNPDGSLARVRLDASCDVDYLDTEAIQAVRTAAPFTNPPPGLVDPDTGLIEFTFGFIFEFGGTSRIFRIQR
jgi:TonB family protein